MFGEPTHSTYVTTRPDSSQELPPTLRLEAQQNPMRRSNPNPRSFGEDKQPSLFDTEGL